jgi:hypothetical protein
MTAMRRCILEQRSHRRCPPLAASAQRHIRELAHHGTASGATAPSLGIDFCEEIVWERDHDLRHSV